MRTSVVMVLLALVAATATGLPRGARSVVVLSKPYNVTTTYAHDCAGDDAACLEAHGLEPTFRPYSQHELDKLLEQRLAQLATVNGGGKRPTNKLADLYMDDDDEEEEANVPVTNVLEQSKSHHHYSSHHHHDDEDDRKEAGGWVTLEPVPWAHSHIQKWEPHAKPQIPSWESGSDHHQYRPVWAEQEHRPRPHQQQHYQQPQQHQHYQQQYDYEHKPWTSAPGRPEIITDDRPGRFPATPPWPAATSDYQSYSAARPPQVAGRPRPGLEEGDGQWVLLSSTKGYSVSSVPHRQRSLRSDAPDQSRVSVSATLSGHRAVRLTVLPPADNSTGTRLSHGGLLEVESSGQTVEESQREHAAKMLRPRPHDDADNEVKPPTPTGAARKVQGTRRSGGVQVYGATGAGAADDRAAVLAALGAGALPATVAVLLPMVLGRRRRRDATDATLPHPTTIHLR